MSPVLSTGARRRRSTADAQEASAVAMLVRGLVSTTAGWATLVVVGLWLLLLWSWTRPADEPPERMYARASLSPVGEVAWSVADAPQATTWTATWWDSTAFRPPDEEVRRLRVLRVEFGWSPPPSLLRRLLDRLGVAPAPNPTAQRVTYTLDRRAGAPVVRDGAVVPLHPAR